MIVILTSMTGPETDQTRLIVSYFANTCFRLTRYQFPDSEIKARDDLRDISTTVSIVCPLANMGNDARKPVFVVSEKVYCSQKGGTIRIFKKILHRIRCAKLFEKPLSNEQKSMLKS